MNEDSNRDETERAFSKALESGRLSKNPHAANYEGHYDYMGINPDHGGDSFKNYRTRLPLEHDTNERDCKIKVYLPTFWRRNGW